jgi:hypothetical protein
MAAKSAHSDVSGGCFEACGGAGDVVNSLTMERLWIVETEGDWLLAGGYKEMSSIFADQKRPRNTSPNA